MERSESNGSSSLISRQLQKLQATNAFFQWMDITHITPTAFSNMPESTTSISYATLPTLPTSIKVLMLLSLVFKSYAEVRNKTSGSMRQAIRLTNQTSSPSMELHTSVPLHPRQSSQLFRQQESDHWTGMPSQRRWWCLARKHPVKENSLFSQQHPSI